METWDAAGWKPAPQGRGAFTLIEMLVVLAIMGLLAAIVVPNLGKFKPNVMAAASQRLLSDVGRARQLAISKHTTVYMVFVPPNFFSDGTAYAALTPKDKEACTNLFDKQYIGYSFVSLRSIGDQPGRQTVRYLDGWRTLPEGAYIMPHKFTFPTPLPVFTITTNNDVGNPLPAFDIYGFQTNRIIPFPTEEAPRWATLPFIAFNYLGQLVDAQGQPLGRNECIPLALGSVMNARDPNKVPQMAVANVSETPPGNSTNSYTLINIDWLTGRARIERQEAR